MPTSGRAASDRPPGGTLPQVRLLVVEDDPAIASFLVKGLKEAGFAVDQAKSGGSALEMASRESYDLAIVDLMLPGLDGHGLIA